MNKELIKQIRAEITFLNCHGIKDLVHEADLECCHADSKAIENRKKKLKKQLNDVIGRNQVQ